MAMAVRAAGSAPAVGDRVPETNRESPVAKACAGRAASHAAEAATDPAPIWPDLPSQTRLARPASPR